MAELLLELTKINKAFPGVKALDDVDFKAKKGEIHALAGENGAGKSTLIKIVTGALKPDSGSFKIGGELIENFSPRLSLEKGIATVYQHLSLIPELTIAENMFLGREKTYKLGYISKRFQEEETRDALRQVKLDIDPNTKILDLEHSTCQLIEIAKALSREAKILLLDEPTSGLSEEEVLVLFKTIKELCATGVSIVYVSHRLGEIFNIADRVTVLRDGKNIDTKKIEEINSNELIDLIIGKTLKARKKDIKRTLNFEKAKTVFQVKGLSIPKSQVKNFSFTLKEREIVGLSGLLGSGQREICQALFGLRPITSGEIYIEGRQIWIKNPVDALRNGLGYLSDDRIGEGLLPFLSVKENLTITNLKSIKKGLFISSFMEKKVAEKMISSLKIVTPSLSQRLAFLSGGNQQKVYIAKWLLAEASILIFHGPTIGVDVGTRRQIYYLIRSLAEEGKSIIIVSYEAEEVYDICDRVEVLWKGSICKTVIPGETLFKDFIYYITHGSGGENIVS